MDASVVASLVACGVAVVTCAISTGMILWKGGAQAERVETSIRQIEDVKRKLDILATIPVIETRIGTLDHVVARILSDFRELRARVDVIGERATRAEIASQHDIGD